MDCIIKFNFLLGDGYFGPTTRRKAENFLKKNGYTKKRKIWEKHGCPSAQIIKIMDIKYIPSFVKA